MKAGAKTPWVLAAVAALLGLYILVFERHHETTDESRATRERLFADLNRGDVTAIEIDRGARGRVTLAHVSGSAGDGAWRIEPSDALATKGAVADLLDALDGLDVDRVATATAASAGLDPPAAHLVVTAAARRFGLEVGGVDASGRGVFVRREGDARVYVVGRRLRDLVDRDAGAFRDRGLFPAAAVDAAAAVAFWSEGEAPQTLRRRAGLWLDEQGTFATRAAVGEALRMLAALQATGFPAAAPPDGGTGPHRTIELGGAGAGAHATARLELWTSACAGDGGAPEHLAAFTATATTAAQGDTREWVCIDASAADRLWRQLEAANRRDSHLLVVDPAGVDGVTLSDGGRRLRLHRDDDGGWRFAEPAAGYDADAKVVGDWLAKLAATTLSAAVPPARTGASHAPARKLVVEGATRAEIEIAPPRGGQSRVDRAGESAPALTGAAPFATLDPEPLRFRSRAVLALPQFDVHAVAIRTPRTRVSLRRETGTTWVREGEGAGATLDASAIDHLLSVLSDLHAEEFVTPQPTSFKPETTLDIEVRAGDAPPQRHRLELGAKCGARLEDTPAFTLPAKTCADLGRTLADIR